MRIVFQSPPPLGFADDDGVQEPNQLVLRVDPTAGARLVVQAQSQTSTSVRTVDLDVDLGGPNVPTPYEELLHAAIVGDATLFTREDVVEETWRVLAPLLDLPSAPGAVCAGHVGSGGGRRAGRRRGRVARPLGVGDVSSVRVVTSALFAGLCVVDLVHRVARPPGPDEKVTALSRELVAGGPATNAAVTFAVLGGSARLLTAVGSGPLGDVVRADLERPGSDPPRRGGRRPGLRAQRLLGPRRGRPPASGASCRWTGERSTSRPR